MIRVWLVRHGEASGSWEEERDPGLSDLGGLQANRAAGELCEGVNEEALLLTSPLRRCRETSERFEALRGMEARVEEALRELPTPRGFGAGRGKWLRARLGGTWEEMLSLLGGEVGAPLGLWRAGLVDFLRGLEGEAEGRDVVAFTHFVAINAAVGAASGSDKIATFRPAPCSLTRMEVEGGVLRLVERGEEMTGTVVVR